MILPLLGTIAKGAIKGMVGRRRRKKGEGAQVSSSIVKVNKNKGDKGDKKSRGLVKPITPMFGGSKEVSTLSSSSIMEALDNIDKSIATIKKILIIESKFKSKVAADNIKAQNLLMKRNQEKKLKSSKTSTSITGKSISKIGSWLSRFLPFVVATLLGSVVLAVYNGLSSIIKFFQGIFKALNGFFVALDPYVRPILDFFNLFKKQDTGELDPKIGETEEEKVNQLEGQVKELDERADVFVKEFNKQKEELLKATTEYQQSVEVTLNKINNDIIIAQSNTPQDTEEIARVDTDTTAAIATTSDTTAAIATTSDTTATAVTPEVTPTVSMVNNNNVNLNQVSDKSSNDTSVKPTTPLVAKKDDGKKENKSSNNLLSMTQRYKKLVEKNKASQYGGEELTRKETFNMKKLEIQLRNAGVETRDITIAGGASDEDVNKAIDSYNKVVGNDPAKDAPVDLGGLLKFEDKNSSEGIGDQAFYETNQTKTNIVFVSQKNSEVASSGGGIIMMGGPSKKSILNSKVNQDLISTLYVG